MSTYRSQRVGLVPSPAPDVKCPHCPAKTARQMPLYDGHGEGIPFATGEFRCEVCGATYNPNDDTSDDSVELWSGQFESDANAELRAELMTNFRDEQ